MLDNFTHEDWQRPLPNILIGCAVELSCVPNILIRRSTKRDAKPSNQGHGPKQEWKLQTGISAKQRETLPPILTTLGFVFGHKWYLKGNWVGDWGREEHAHQAVPSSATNFHPVWGGVYDVAITTLLLAHI